MSDNLPCSWELWSSQRKLSHFGRVLCSQVFFLFFFFFYSSPEIEGTPLPSQQLNNKPAKELFLPIKPG